jgi:hypothetical protein
VQQGTQANKTDEKLSFEKFKLERFISNNLTNESK